MEQDNDQIKTELLERKEKLNNMLAEFNKLKDEKKWLEAWSQLIATLNYANETLRYSAGLLKNIQTKIPFSDAKVQEELSRIANKPVPATPKKMIVIPKKQVIN